jgi:thioredoxin reductase (NADPH)
MREVIILGSGPAGLTAAIYAARYQRRPLVVAGQAVGGNLLWISHMENYPGFPEGIEGPALAGAMQKQAEHFGAEFLGDSVTGVDFSQQPFRVQFSSGSEEARSVIISTGTMPGKLGVPGEDKFVGRGVSYCATCDGFFYRGKTVAVIGGGNSCLQEAVELTQYASKVYVVHRRKQLRAMQMLQETVFNHPKVEAKLGYGVDEVLGDGKVTGVRLIDVQTGEKSDLLVDGVFVYVGSTPNTTYLQGQLDLDERGYVVAGPFGHTSVGGVFAAGDLRQGAMGQVVIAAGSGAQAAMSAEGYLEQVSQSCPFVPAEKKSQPAS